MKSCDDFFMEVVSTLCFGQATVPDGDLIEMLLNLIFTEATSADGTITSTKQLTSHKQRTDDVPVIRSFLLQLLLGQTYVSLHPHNLFTTLHNSYLTCISLFLVLRFCMDIYRCFLTNLYKLWVINTKKICS